MDQLPPSVVSDRRRLQAVSELELSDSARNPELDDLAELVAEVLDVPVALVSILEVDRQRVPGASGLPEPFASCREVPIRFSLCARVIESAASLVIHDAANDPRVAQHPAIATLGIGAYLGVPIGRSDNGPLGTLCVMDDKKRSWTPRELRLLQSLAGSADSILAARRGQYSMGSFDRVFRGFVAAVPDPVVVTDGEGAVTHQNDAARACLGADLTGAGWQKTLSALMLQADGVTPYAPGEDPLARAIRGETTRGERVRWGSSDAWYEITAQPVREHGGRLIGAVSLWKNVTAEQVAQQRLAILADRDDLTGLGNRRAFLANAEAALPLARRRRQSATLLLADVDGLKPINDQLGHEGGDDAIRGAADVLRAALPRGTLLARLSGDEIVALLLHAEEGAVPLAREQIGVALARWNERQGRRFRLSLSVGHDSAGPDEATTLDELLRNADAAMETEKRAKR